MPESAAIAISTAQDVTVATVTAISVLDPLQIDRIGVDLYALGENPLIPKLVIDMGEVKHLSSAALGMLINLDRKCKASKGSMVICGLAPELHKVFKISNLDRLFRFEKDQGKALKHYGVKA